MSDQKTMPCGHSSHWQVARNPVDYHSERYCLFCEVERLRAIVSRLPVTADGVPVTLGMDVWIPFSVFPQKPFTIAVISARQDYSVCYSTPEAAAAAREAQS
jgi:hypothetical protein